MLSFIKGALKLISIPCLRFNKDKWVCIWLKYTGGKGKRDFSSRTSLFSTNKSILYATY